jgi:hypothetical protein
MWVGFFRNKARAKGVKSVLIRVKKLTRNAYLGLWVVMAAAAVLFIFSLCMSPYEFPASYKRTSACERERLTLVLIDLFVKSVPKYNHSLAAFQLIVAVELAQELVVVLRVDRRERLLRDVKQCLGLVNIDLFRHLTLLFDRLLSIVVSIELVKEICVLWVGGAGGLFNNEFIISILNIYGVRFVAFARSTFVAERRQVTCE